MSIISSRRRSSNLWVQSGFTLIELLVVIAIIAILAAILFPVFAQAKAAAKKAACISNVKQISIANLMYMGDYDDVTPQLQYVVSPGVNRYIWGELTGGATWDFTKGTLQPYMKNVPIIDCPAASQVVNFNATQRGLAYGMNSDVMSLSTLRTVTGSSIEATAETIFIGDQRLPYVSPVMTGLGLSCVGYAFTNFADGRHAGQASIAWMDGHAKGMKPSVGNSTYAGGTSGSYTIMSAAQAKQANIGWILYGAYQGGDTNNGPSERDCYYYRVTKPSTN